MTPTPHPRALLPAVALLALAAGAPATASAADAPAAVTGTAVQITPSTATLRGSVNPRDVQTAYVFQYGPTTAYGATTPAVAVGKGTKARSAAAAVTGLAPATTYHFRVVATSGAGTGRGRDRTFTTAKQPLGLSLAATPNPVAFGSPTTLAGTLTGTDNANRQVVLVQNAFPFTAGFAPVGNPQVTGPTGAFSFPILGLGITTQFRAQIPGQFIASPIVTTLVAVSVSTRVSDTTVRRGRRIRFSGTVTPIRDGALVSLQKLDRTRWVTVARSTARHYQASRSRYSVRTTVKRGGSYRVLIRTRGGDIADNTGREVKVRSFRRGHLS